MYVFSLLYDNISYQEDGSSKFAFWHAQKVI